MASRRSRSAAVTSTTIPVRIAQTRTSRAPRESTSGLDRRVQSTRDKAVQFEAYVPVNNGLTVPNDFRKGELGHKRKCSQLPPEIAASVAADRNTVILLADGAG